MEIETIDLSPSQDWLQEEWPLPEGPESVTIEDREYVNKIAFQKFKDIKIDLSKKYLVQGLLDERSCSMLYGQSNCGKSFFSGDLALHLSMGKPWHGRKIKKCGTIIVAAEAGLGYARRIEAFGIFHKNKGDDLDFALIPCSLNFQQDEDVSRLIDAIVSASKTFTEKLGLVVIDTAARVFGGDENSGKDMSKFLRSIELIREKTQAHVLIVHHSGKNEANGARGHSSLRAAIDVEMEISDFTMRVTKAREYEFANPISFRLTSVTIGKDEDGLPITSCVVETSNLPGPMRNHELYIRAGSEFSKYAKDNSLGVPTDWHDVHLMVSKAGFREYFYRSLYPDSPKQTKNGAFNSVLEKWADKGLIICRETYLCIVTKLLPWEGL